MTKFSSRFVCTSSNICMCIIKTCVMEGRTSHRAIPGFGMQKQHTHDQHKSKQKQQSRQEHQQKQSNPHHSNQNAYVSPSMGKLGRDSHPLDGDSNAQPSHADDVPAGISADTPVDMMSAANIPIHHLTMTRFVFSLVFGAVIFCLLFMFQPVWICATDAHEVSMMDAFWGGVLASGFYFVLPLFLYN